MSDISTILDIDVTKLDLNDISAKNKLKIKAICARIHLQKKANTPLPDLSKYSSQDEEKYLSLIKTSVKGNEEIENQVLFLLNLRSFLELYDKKEELEEHYTIIRRKYFNQVAFCVSTAAICLLCMYIVSCFETKLRKAC